MRRKTRNLITGCLSLTMSVCLALSVGFALPTKTAKAEDGTKAFVTAKGATVTANQTFNSHTKAWNNANTDANQDITGLGVVAAAPYSASFNTAFSGDLQLKYLFPDADETRLQMSNTPADNVNATDGQFTFRIANLENPDVYIELNTCAYSNGGITWATSYHAANGVTYNRRNAGWNNNITNYQDSKEGSIGWFRSGFNSNRSWNGQQNETQTTNNVKSMENGIGLFWKDDVLTLGYLISNHANSYYSWSDTNSRTTDEYLPIMNFDGATVLKNTETSAVPKFPSKNYTISFSSSWKTGTDVVFTAINKNVLNGAAATVGEDVLDVPSAIANADGVSQTVANGSTVEVAKNGTLSFRDSTFKKLTGFSNAGGTGYAYLPVEGDVLTPTGTTVDLASAALYEGVVLKDGLTVNVHVMNSVSVKFNVNDVAKQTLTKQESEIIYLPDCLEELSGKAFRGWKVDGDDTLYQAGDAYTVGATDVIFKGYYKDMFAVNYLVDGATATTEYAVDGEVFTVGEAPSLSEDKTFLGWRSKTTKEIFTVGSEHVGISEAMSFIAVYANGSSSDAKLAATSLISSNEATVTAHQTFNEHTKQANGTSDANQDVTGLGVVAEGTYSAKFTPVFNGNLQFMYLFPDTEQTKTIIDNTNQTKVNCTDGQFTFRITSNDNPNVYIELTNAVKNGGGGGDALSWAVSYRAADGVTYNRYNNTWTLNQVSYQNGTNANMGWLVSGFNSNRNQANGLGVFWNGDVLTVGYKMTNHANNAYTWKCDTIADQDVKTLDGYLPMITLDGETGTPSGTKCAVPKFPSKNYTISFSSTMGTDVVFTSINGNSLSAVTSETTFIAERAVEQTFVDTTKGTALRANDTVYTPQNGTLPITVSSLVALKGLSNDKGATTLSWNTPFEYTSENLDLTTVGNYTIKAKSDPDFTLNVTVTSSRTVTYNWGTAGTSSVTVSDGQQFLLLDAPTDGLDGKTFIGWTSNINDGIFKAGSTHGAITGDATFTAVLVDFSMVAGASVRKVVGTTGIRFTSKINTDDYTQIMNVAKLGTLIAPVDLVGSAENLTFAQNASNYLDIEAVNWLTDTSLSNMGYSDGDTYKYFTGVMSNVQLFNYARQFVARPYVTVTYADESTETFYGNDSGSRSIYYVATECLKANETDTNGVLQGYVNGVADFTVSGDTVSIANEKATYVINSQSCENNVFTVEVSGLIGSLILNGTWVYADGMVAGDITVSSYTITQNVNANTTTITFTRAA